jgi:predicted nucleic acid-binding protein
LIYLDTSVIAAFYWAEALSDRVEEFNTSLRTLDALHLACASSNNLCLVTADEVLAASAEALEIEAQLLRPKSDRL